MARTFEVYECQEEINLVIFEDGKVIRILYDFNHAEYGDLIKTIEEIGDDDKDDFLNWGDLGEYIEMDDEDIYADISSDNNLETRMVAYGEFGGKKHMYVNIMGDVARHALGIPDIDEWTMGVLCG